jgi:hypothetical protein
MSLIHINFMTDPTGLGLDRPTSSPMHVMCTSTVIGWASLDVGGGPMLDVVVACPECGVRAAVLPREDRVIEDAQGKCRHRINPLNCPTTKAAFIHWAPGAKRTLQEINTSMTKAVRKPKWPNWGAGTRTNSTDRDAMVEAFRQHFTEAFRQHSTEPLSRKAAGQLFDKYLRNGVIDILWDGTLESMLSR